jgi:Ser/Thr protein kinase RdoA (MazF antagonist)
MVAAAPYTDLSPDAVLNAIDALGLPTSGALLALNSYENRVFQVGVDDAQRFVVAKFYRPGRWSDAQILEEHAFTQELAAAEIPVVPPMVVDGRTLHERGGFRFALYPRRGGRAPNLDDAEVLEWLGRFLGRIHAVGAQQSFLHRPTLDLESFGREPRAWLLSHDWLPPELRNVYAGVSQQALDGIEQCYARAGSVRAIRLHGDTHEGNVLWTEGRVALKPGQESAPGGPHFVDFDDARMGPAVQDFWMLLGDREQRPERLKALLTGYEDFAEFDDRELALVEALRTLRLLHYSAWIARRWDDPAFPAAFPWFNTQRYWEDRILELREQIAAMNEAPFGV